MLRNLMMNVMTRYGPIEHFKYDWSQYRSTWEPELVSKVGENELNRLKTEAIRINSSNGPMSPNSIGTNNNSSSCQYSPNTHPANSSIFPPNSTAAHRSVAIFKDYTDPDGRIQSYPHRSDEMAHHHHHPQEDNCQSRRGWFRRLFCL